MESTQVELKQVTQVASDATERAERELFELQSVLVSAGGGESTFI